MTDQLTSESLSSQVYQARLAATRLRREVFNQTDPARSQDLLDELEQAESELSAAEAALSAVEAADPSAGTIVDTSGGQAAVMGAETTGLEVQVHLRMAQLPTALYHLLQVAQTPLVSCRVRNSSSEIRRVRVTTFIEGYSARASSTFEISPAVEYTFNQLPTLFHDRVRDITELTRASLNLLVEDLDTGKVEIHETYPLWLLARSTAPLLVRDPKTGGWQDLSLYFGAFVTPNAPAVMEFLREAAAFHPKGQLSGYQGDRTAVEPQIRAIFEALKQKANITYVNSVITFSPEEGAANQRVRLPAECLKTRQANCIDGTLLFASLIEAISMSPAIILIPGHAFLAWETWGDGSGEWRYLETTMTGTHSFEEACASAERSAAQYKRLATATSNPFKFRLWPVRVLRSKHGITPME
jgi:hypothetical protein